MFIRAVYASLVGTNGDDARLVVGGHRCLFGRDVGRTGAAWRPRRPGAPTPQTPRAAAPLDLTGSWVAVISEDWRWRMVTPAKGDYVSIPITQAAKDTADTWDRRKTPPPVSSVVPTERRH